MRRGIEFAIWGCGIAGIWLGKVVGAVNAGGKLSIYVPEAQKVLYASG